MWIYLSRLIDTVINRKDKNGGEGPQGWTENNNKYIHIYIIYIILYVFHAFRSGSRKLNVLDDNGDQDGRVM